jgi:hypothetical protein
MGLFDGNTLYRSEIEHFFRVGESTFESALKTDLTMRKEACAEIATQKGRAKRDP